MIFKALLSVLAIAASTALANTNYVENNCQFDVYVTSVSTSAGPTNHIGPGEYWSENQYYNGTGTAIKVTRTQDGLWTNQPVLTFAYTYQPNEPIYYGLSTDKGYDFNGVDVWLGSEYNPNVTMIEWDGIQGSDATAAYDGATDLTLSFCA